MLTPKYDIDFHRRAFECLCRELSPYSYECIIGFITHHGFVAGRTDLLSVKQLEADDMRTIGKIFGEIASKYGHPIETCAAEIDLDEFGITHGACVDRKQIEEIVGNRFDKVKERYLRPHCNCMEAVDIGHYSTCDNGCLYCYATPRRLNMNVIPLSPSLDPAFDITKIPAERIVEVECQSFRPSQMSLW